MKKRHTKSVAIAKPGGELKQIVAGFSKDPFTSVFQGLLKPSDETLIAKGGSKGLAIYDEIERDCHAYAVLQKRKYAIASYPWDVDPASDDSADVKAADGIREFLESLDVDGLTIGLLDAILKGYAVAEIEWNPETWLPVKFHMRDQRRFLFDEESKPRLITPENRTTGEELPERKFIVHRFGAKNGNPYGLGLGTRLFWPAFFKKQGIAFWAAFAEKFGGPTILGKYPDFMDEPKQQKFLEALTRASQETAIIAPLGAELELIEAARSGSIDTYERLLRYMDEEISKAVLGETLTTNLNSDSGSYAASQTHNGVRLELIRADADMLSQTLNETLMTWLTEFHFPGANPPRLWRRVEESQNTKAEAEKDALVFGLGYEPEEEFIKEKYGEGWTKRSMPTSGFDWDGVAVPGMQPAAADGSAATPDGYTPPDGTDGQPQTQPQQSGGLPTGGLVVQDTALNGAQVSSLVQVIESVATAVIPKETAIYIIRAAFPSISPEMVSGMVNPVIVKEKEPVQPAPQQVKEPLEYSELDEITDKTETAGASAMEKLLEPVRRLVNNARTLEEIRDGLLELYPEMDTEPMTELLTDAFTAAFLKGKLDVKQQ